MRIVRFLVDGAAKVWLVSFISAIMPLFPGDIIATGMKPGDAIEIEIGGIGRLRNTVTRQP